MSTYTSSIISGGNLNAAQLKTELEALAGKLDVGYQTSLLSSASGTWVNVLTKSITPTTDIMILVLATFDFSSSDGAASTGRVQLLMNSVQLYSDWVFGDSYVSSEGATNSKTIIGAAENLSGTMDVQLQFSRNSGSGTIYVSRALLQVLQFKKR